jgi:two-component system, response regulator
MSTQPRILLADDDSSDAELTTRALEQACPGCKIAWVQDGEEALDYILRTGKYASREPGNPRLMLLDLHMPRVDGLEVLNRLKSAPATRAIPVIITSSSDQASDVMKSYALHANSYFVKPVDFQQFMERMALLGRYWLEINCTS